MELWLKRMIRDLPAAWKTEVERYLRDGTFISFAELPQQENSAGLEAREQLQGVEAEEDHKFRLMIRLLDDPPWQGVVYRNPETSCGNGGVKVSLPTGLNAEALLRATLMKGAAFVPGALGFAAGEEPDALLGGPPDPGVIRLYYSAHSEEEIREGMARIAEALTEFTARSLE